MISAEIIFFSLHYKKIFLCIIIFRTFVPIFIYRKMKTGEYVKRYSVNLKIIGMKKLLFFITFIICATISNAQWEQTSLYNGDITSIVINEPNIFASYGAGKIVYLSTNNGTSWTPVNSGLPTNVPVMALAVSGNNLFGATQGEGVYLSTNNGTSWSVLNNGLPTTLFQDYSILITGGNIFVGSFGGVGLSTDNGANWSAVNSGLPAGSFLIYSMTSNGPNIFTSFYGGGIYLSTNNGASWTAVNTGLTSLNVSALAAIGSNIFAGAGGAGAFLSNNNGTSWTLASFGLTNSDIRAFAISGTNIFAGTWGGGVYISKNNGTSWTQMSEGLTGNALYIESLAASGDTLFAGGGYFGVWRRAISEMTGVEEKSERTSFSIFPNPFSTSTQISFDKTYQNLDLAIIDLQGKIIQQKSYHDCNKITLDRAGIANGFYFLRVSLDGKFVETKKIVVTD